ncbi:NAD(P)/FAD-dependent oxidoreductase [Gordonia jinhuaensis]|uniref:NAD(P)/FAD-dependent oxidoreductase n=1 Tax=Gordonia jinhuaensis TaxID=1517702 RepID=UPI001E597B36|nr:FAD-dependent oxidoreductase [Gordonia jinhuaensis]
MTDLSVGVIGGGIAGAATAFALARRGVSVEVFDSDATGRATAAGAGIIQPWSSSLTGPAYDLYSAGAQYYPTLRERLADVGQDEIGYRMSGSLVVDNDPARLDATEARIRQRTAVVPIAGRAERIDAAQAGALFAPLAPDLEAVFIPGGARVDGRALCAALLAGARSHGATVTGRQVMVGEIDGAAVIVDDSGTPSEFDSVVVAAGAWSNQVLSGIGPDGPGTRLPLEPQRGQIAHLNLTGTATGDWPSIIPPGSHYLVAFDDGRVVAGATRETGSGYDPRVTAAGTEQVLADALAIAPGLSEATLGEMRVGLRPMTTDGRALVGELDVLDGLFVNAGFGAAGLTMAPLVGEVLADQILGTGTTAQDFGIDPATLAPLGRIEIVDDSARGSRSRQRTGMRD